MASEGNYELVQTLEDNFGNETSINAHCVALVKIPKPQHSATAVRALYIIDGRPSIQNITVDGILCYKQATTPDRIG